MNSFLQKPGIYCIICTINQKRYIGSSLNISKRITSHKMKLRRKEHANIYLQRAYDKYGKENFKFLLIEYTEDLKKEEFWINYYNSNNKKLGYNMESFKRGRKVHSDETKLKISNSNKGKRKGMLPSLEQIERIREYGKQPKSEEHKRKISESHKGKKRKPFTEEWKQKMKDSRKKYLESLKIKEQISLF